MKNKMFKKSWLEVLLVFLFIVLLMIISLMLMKDINIGNNIINYYILIKGMFLSVIIGGTIHSYSQSKDALKIQLCFGLTRKKIFFDNLKKILQVMLIALTLSVFYAWLCEHLNGTHINAFKIMYHQGILFLLEILLLSFLLGFFTGLLRMKSVIAFIICIVIFFGLYFIIDIFKGNVLINIILLIVSLLFIGLDYLLLEKVRIE